MNDATGSSITERYAGDAGERWMRIERGRPRGWLEHNVVFGRKRLHRRLLEWLQPLAGLRVLDAGCGIGTLARELAIRGAEVTGVDLVQRFVAEARAAATGSRQAATPSAAAGRPPEFFVADFRELLAGDRHAAFDAMLLIEVLEDYTRTERWEILTRAADSRIGRLYLAFRTRDDGVASIWNRLPGAGQGGIDAVELLRWVHRRTLYRQTRREVIRVRNYRAWLAELVLGTND